jgi:endoglucanase
MKRLIMVLGMPGIGLAVCVLAGCPQPPRQFVKSEDGKVVLGDTGNEIRLAGVTFSNWYWGESPSEDHHNGEDFQRVSALGMNSIRFAMNYRFFESDGDPYEWLDIAWYWMDQNIAWAREHGIYLVPAMYAPQGISDDFSSMADLWLKGENQKRLIALWTAIAERYADENIIAAWDILHAPSDMSEISQWSALAGQIVTAIRAVDPNHMIILDAGLTNAMAEAGTDTNPDARFPVTDAGNIMYGFEFFDPLVYTYQLLEGTGLGEFGSWPRPDELLLPDLVYAEQQANNPSPPRGSTDWTWYEGQLYQPQDAAIRIAVPSLYAFNMAGTVYFDDFSIREYDSEGELLQTVFEIDPDSLEDWQFSSGAGDGAFGLADTGHEDDRSLYIENVSRDGILTSTRFAFKANPANSYKISGWMKTADAKALAQSRYQLSFYSTVNDEPVYTLDEEYLQARLDRWLLSETAAKAPIMVTGMGCNAACFEAGRGATAWYESVLDILKTENASLTLWSYNDAEWGLYDGGDLPSEEDANNDLIALLTRIFNGSGWYPVIDNQGYSISETGIPVPAK